MAARQIDVMPMFAALLPDGAVLLELAIGDAERLVKVTMPASDQSQRLADGRVITLDLDELPRVAPGLSGEIDAFVSEIRQRLGERATAVALRGYSDAAPTDRLPDGAVRVPPAAPSLAVRHDRVGVDGAS